MKKIIIGGGRVGRELATRLSESIIVEIDPKKKEKLSRIEGAEVVIGDGSNEEVLKKVGLEDAYAFISLTSNDDVNYRAAVIARKYGIPKIIVRVEDPEDCERFQKLGVDYILFPTKIIADFISDLIYDLRKTKIYKPFEKILVPLLQRDMTKKAFKEALLMASLTRAKLTVVSFVDIDIEEIESMAMKMSVPLRIIMGKENIIKKHVHRHVPEILELVKTHVYHQDCIVIGHEDLGIIDRLLKRSFVLKLIKHASCPVLVARTFKYYKHILSLIDSSDISEVVGRYAVQMAHLYHSALHLLILGDVPSERVERIKRMGEEGDVRVIEKKVEGNLMIEVVKEVKSGDYELVVLPWKSTGVIWSDLIKRMINYAPCSVLVVN
ncbi:MAG: NAD-binding protein [Candidatus Methanospirareceae archaeon]